MEIRDVAMGMLVTNVVAEKDYVTSDSFVGVPSACQRMKL